VNRVCKYCNENLDIKRFYKLGKYYQSICRTCNKEVLLNKKGKKFCNQCEQEKPYSEFSICKNSFLHICKKCKNSNGREKFRTDEDYRKRRLQDSHIHRENNKEWYKEYNHNRLDKGRVYGKAYRDRHIEKVRARGKKNQMVSRQTLSDRYLKQLINKHSAPANYIPPQLIKLKRLQILGKRILKQKSNGSRTTTRPNVSDIERLG
jgi:hypothetical protein